jgi:hypothetical protein
MIFFIIFALLALATPQLTADDAAGYFSSAVSGEPGAGGEPGSEEGSFSDSTVLGITAAGALATAAIGGGMGYSLGVDNKKKASAKSAIATPAAEQKPITTSTASIAKPASPVAPATPEAPAPKPVIPAAVAGDAENKAASTIQSFFKSRQKASTIPNDESANPVAAASKPADAATPAKPATSSAAAAADGKPAEQKPSTAPTAESASPGAAASKPDDAAKPEAPAPKPATEASSSPSSAVEDKDAKRARDLSAQEAEKAKSSGTLLPPNDVADAETPSDAREGDRTPVKRKRAEDEDPGSPSSDAAETPEASAAPAKPALSPEQQSLLTKLKARRINIAEATSWSTEELARVHAEAKKALKITKKLGVKEFGGKELTVKREDLADTPDTNGRMAYDELRKKMQRKVDKALGKMAEEDAGVLADAEPGAPKLTRLSKTADGSVTHHPGGLAENFTADSPEARSIGEALARRKQKVEAKAAATKIQTIARGKLARNKLNNLRATRLLIPAQPKK